VNNKLDDKSPKMCKIPSKNVFGKIIVLVKMDFGSIEK